MDMQLDNWRQLMINGSSILYRQTSILEKDVTRMEVEGFEVVQFNCNGWNEENFHEDIAGTMKFPSYYGENLDAFSDCLSDIEPKNTGILLVFHHFHSFFAQYPELAIVILDIIQVYSWRFLLKGKVLLSFIQTDNPKIVIPAIGGIAPQWNGAEWLDINREL